MPFEKNHRVKLMSGFGMAITTKDNQIILKNGKHFYDKCPFYDRTYHKKRDIVDKQILKNSLIITLTLRFKLNS